MENMLIIIFIAAYIALFVLNIIKLKDSNQNNKKGIKIILIISTIVFIIGILLYANEITPHSWVKELNTPGYWDNDPELEEYFEQNKVLINIKYYGGILLIIISYIGNILAIVKNNKTIKDNTKIID